MARGQQSKELFYQKMLEMFEGSFLYNGNKEIRIPYLEDGKEIQLKIVATCAKDNVSAGADTALPGESQGFSGGSSDEIATPTIVEPTQEELDNVSSLMASLNL